VSESRVSETAKVENEFIALETRGREATRPEEDLSPLTSSTRVRGVRSTSDRRSDATNTEKATLASGASIVKRMLNRSGNSLFTAIEPLDESEFFAAGPNGISIAWTIGHLACVLDLFTSWIHGQGCRLPKAVHNTFNSLELKPSGGPSKADIVKEGSYRKADILFLLRSAQVNALKLLSTCREQDWNEPPPGAHPDNLHTVGEIWEHLAVHTYWHMGELCGTFARFHGTYTLNMLPHYFYYAPGSDRG
jgi:hypothetical protein